MYGLTCSADVADTRRWKHAATQPRQAKQTSYKAPTFTSTSLRGVSAKSTVCDLSPELIHHRTPATTSESRTHSSHITQPPLSQLKGFANPLGIAAEQMKDDAFSKIIRALESSDSLDEINVDPDDYRAALLRKQLNQFFLEPGTSVLRVRDSNHSPKLVVPYKLHNRYLHQAHEGTNHSGVTRMHEPLSNYWWEFKNCKIKSYVDSCDTCAKCQDNYRKRTRWPIGHCKRSRRPFELVLIDFVKMPNSKGKRYIFTILDSFSRHFTAIPCARDRAIDTARGLYQFFLRHREIPHIVSSDCGTHFTGEVYKQFCAQMFITQEVHCPWRPQSPGNIERQHRTMKKPFYMLFEDRNCE